MITFGFKNLYLDKSGTSARDLCLNLLKVYFPCLPCIPWTLFFIVRVVYE